MTKIQASEYKRLYIQFSIAELNRSEAAARLKSFIQGVLQAIVIVAAMLPLSVEARGERELVAVLAARVRWGLSQRPEMPDQPPNLLLRNVPSAHESPAPMEQHDSSQADTQTSVSSEARPGSGDAEIVSVLTHQAEALESEVVELSARNHEMARCIEKLTRELIESKGLHALPTAGDATGAPLPNEAVPSAPSPAVSLNLVAPARGVPSPRPYDVVVATATWCVHCPRFKKANADGDALVRLRYVDVDYAKPADVPQTWWEAIQANRGLGLPMSTWIDGKGQMQHVHGANWTTPQIQAAIEFSKNNPPERRNMETTAETAVGGAIHSGGRIKSLLSLWSTQLGPEATVSLKWDRSGQQSLSATKLMHGELWTPTMVAGQFGHVSLKTTSTMLPARIQEFGFSYRTLDNSRFSVDADALTINLPTTAPPRIAGTQACGFLDPVSIGFDIYSFFSILHQVLNPQIDVGLGGTVDLNAKMSGSDKLVIKFTECPSIHIDAWVQFDLQVQSVEIAPANVHVAFKPQPRNWIRIDSRDFPVTD